MADVNALYQEQYVFGDVGGVIGDALQIADHHTATHVGHSLLEYVHAIQQNLPSTRVLRTVSFMRFKVRRKVDLPQPGATRLCP